MEKTVQHVEAMFQKADSDIKNLSQRLKYEFECNNDTDVNPAHLMQKIGEVKKEYAAIVQQASAIQQAQKEAVQEFQTQLTSVLALLQRLQDQPGLMGERPEELDLLEQLLGTSIPFGTEPGQGSEVTGGGSSHLDETGAGDSTIHSQQSELDHPSGVGSPHASSPATLRKMSGEFVDITQDEFESVSTSTRGRAKLAEVNSTYRILWEHFKGDKSCKSLNTQEMSKIGLKIAGQTGQAKLKVLKSLKLITLTPRGDVTGVV